MSAAKNLYLQIRPAIEAGDLQDATETLLLAGMPGAIVEGQLAAAIKLSGQRYRQRARALIVKKHLRRIRKEHTR